MTLTAGTRIGPYEVVSMIGAGGMGEVYKARDGRLKRDVALKVLPDTFATDPERLARFEREAQVLASLNHPHIAHIHGLEGSGNVRAFVMELVEGEDLAERIARGSVPVDEALPLARQIAEAFVAAGADGTRRLWVRPLGSVVMQSLGGTEGASYPFWSPEGEQVGFFADGKLKKVSVAGADVTTLCDAPYAAGGSWSPDGTIVFAPTWGSALQQIPAAGGSPRAATILNGERHESTHRWPAFLPDGRRFLLAVSQQAKAGVWMIRFGSLDSSRVEDVLEADSNALYANGSLLFARSGRLLAQPVNERSMRPVGNAVPLAENVLRDSVLGKAVFSTSQTGRLVFQSGSPVVGLGSSG